MDWVLVVVAFLIGIIIRPAVVALAKGETINFSMNSKYFAFSFRTGKSGKMSKRKPAPDEEPKNETTSDEEPGEETTPGDEPNESISEEESRDETNPDDEPKEKISDEESRGETNPGDKPKDEPDDKPKDDPGNSPKDGNSPGNTAIGTAIGATVGAGVALVGLPLCIGALGFTGAGIAAGSFAAKMMSAAAIANGGGVAAGSTVAVLQSVGAAGFSLGTKIGLTSALSTVGGASGAWLSKWKKPPNDKLKKNKNPSDKPQEKVTQVTNMKRRQLQMRNPGVAKQVPDPKAGKP